MTMDQRGDETANVRPKIAIVGLGLIGRGWAIVFARGGHQVTVHDHDPAATDSGLAAVETSVRDLARLGLLAETPEVVLARITPHATLEDAVSDAAYVQENVAETLDAKRSIFRTLDEL